jgi:hypothetical protein
LIHNTETKGEIKMSMAGFRSTTCVQCGRGFIDDCGDAFCSSSCEREYERENETEECSRCGTECKPDELYKGLCEYCEEDVKEEESE